MWSEAVVQLLAGAIAVPVCQWLKKTFKLDGTRMLWAAVLISIVLSVAVSVLTGAGGITEILTNPALMLQGTGIIFGTAQVLFRSIKEKLDLKLPSETL
ncbi:MAG: hypothetical protein M0R22_01015 [Dehalococcoidia bacterium]|jgi:hypothetical protein|nr:hypothetical protein [Dehalococcoidia bacterium]